MTIRLPMEPLTQAERSGFRRTSTHAQVLEFLERLRRRASSVRVETIGRSGEGRPMPAVIISPARAFTPAAADRKGLLKILVIANIHAGEVEGKEACLMLARDLTLRRPPTWLKRCVLVLIPNYNPDGNDRISPRNRRLDLRKLDGQVGPEGGAGTRYTGAGINLNRDYMKQEAVETVHLARAFGRWRPHLTIDCHTTDGSIHGYHLTYDTSHPIESAPSEPILYVRDTLLPEIGRRLVRRTGIRTFFYGNYRDQKDPTKGWETYSPLPRYGSHYRGLTGRMDILLETYSYIPFDRRVEVMYATLLETFRTAAAHAKDIRAIVDRAERDTIARGQNPSAFDRVGIAYGIARELPRRRLAFRYPAHPFPRPVMILGWDRETLRLRRLEGGRLTRYRGLFYGRFAATRSVARPFSYVVPKELVPRLRNHNIRVERLIQATRVDLQRYVVLDICRAQSPDVGSRPREETVLSVRAESVNRRLPAGSCIVRTAQPFAHVAIYLLEPESDDGFSRWGFLDRRLRIGREFPVLRIDEPLRLGTRPIR